MVDAGEVKRAGSKILCVDCREFKSLSTNVGVCMPNPVRQPV